MISIIIPVLDEEAAIGATLEHLLGLRGNIEVIVVDGGSEDRTVAIASRYAKVLPGPRGRGRQMNFGARRANGSVLLFLHADTRLPENAIAGVERALADPEVVGGRFKIRLSNPSPVFRLIASMINLRDRFFRGFTGDQAIFVRTEVFRQLGGYFEASLMEDLDFGKRLARVGKVARVPLCVTTSSRRWEQNGVLKTILLMWTLRFLFVMGCPPSFLKRFYGETR